jgi:hypothetical protein
MSKSKNVTLVPASRVREAFNLGLFKAPEAAMASLVGKNGDGRVRGRLNPAAVQAFNEQVKGEQYAGEKSAVEAKSITLPLVKPNAKGALLKRPESVARVASARPQSRPLLRRCRPSAAGPSRAPDLTV